ncbi:MAG: cytochrome b/b6 domain-containing protein [Sandaracinaceae bacterium]|nr:cytochrome b/b6 domain-containing protein [Sandaracinaceae bacterium]
MKKRTLVWDLPTRLFHWLFAAGFLGALGIAASVGHRDPTFLIHKLLGAVVGFMVLLRLVWGLVGSRWSRFRDFTLRPKLLLEYLRGVFGGSERRYSGHNPATSFAAVGIFGLVLATVATALLAPTYRFLGEVHGVLAWTTLAVVVLHVAGVVLHSYRRRENITMSMVDGRKDAPAAAAIPSTRRFAAVAFVALTALFTAGLVHNYDPTAGTVTVPLVGTVRVARPAGNPGDPVPELPGGHGQGPLTAASTLRASTDRR